MKRIIVVVMFGLLAACATTEQQTVEPIPSIIDAGIAAQLGSVTIPADKSLIYLYRPDRYVGGANIYRITLNGTPVADMKVGTRLATPVVPGQTTLEGRSLASPLNVGLALAMMEKPNIVFETQPGRAYFIDVKTGFAGGPQFEFVDADTGLEAAKSLRLADPAEEEEG